MSLIFYDFEVFKCDWMVVFIDPGKREETVIVNDSNKFAQFYNDHKNDIWVGYNSRNYDIYIAQAILCGFDPKEMNDWIIAKGHKGWEFSDILRSYPINNFDIMTSFHGLKQLEAFMGSDIEETSVPFDIDRKLTVGEIAQTIHYCRHDVQQTIEVFIHRVAEFNAQLSIIKTFKLPMSYIGKTQAQLAAILLGAKRVELFDEWAIRLPDTLQLNKYQCVADWFMNPKNHDPESNLEIDIAGVPHVFAWGGVHGAKAGAYAYTCKEDELLVMADVDQLYPSVMVQYDLLSRAVKDPKPFKVLLDTSLRLKAEGKKAEREPYKRICNITYGTMGDQYNAMYDPLHRSLVCIFGQLLALDLIEKVEAFAELIQSNTDGVLLKIKRADFSKLDDAVFEWETRTRLHMSFDCYERVVQKDVNNYVVVDHKGHFKCKGAYVKQLTDVDNDLPIVNQAVTDCIISGKDPKQTIMESERLIDFQKVVKVSRKYAYAIKNGERLNDKTFRVFASTRGEDGMICKVKITKDGEKVEKFANTPEKCFIDNRDIRNADIVPYLDRRWYIELAIKRLKDFGVEVTE